MEGQADRHLSAACEAFARVDPLDSRATHDALAAELEAEGWTVETEVPVLDRGDGRAGRVDLRARRGGVTIIAEADNAVMRDKSLSKLKRLDGYRIGVLRKSAVPIVPTGLHALVVLEWTGAAEQVDARQVFVLRDTDAWRAWQAHLKATRGRGSASVYKPEHGGDGWFFASEWPPGYAPAHVHPSGRRLEVVR